MQGYRQQHDLCDGNYDIRHGQNDHEPHQGPHMGALFQFAQRGDDLEDEGTYIVRVRTGHASLQRQERHGR